MSASTSAKGFLSKSPSFLLRLMTAPTIVAMGAQKTHRGLVVLLGAGPGDATLLTTAGVRWLRVADTVIYDRLVNPALLELARRGAELIHAGKGPGGEGPSQQEINTLLVEKCRAGRLVVRLKGGDPFVFGRGGEEARALAAAGLEFRIVPGITAGVAAAGFAGIPLTDRRLASTVAFVTGREDPDKKESRINWDALARIDTLVFYMGAGSVRTISQRLLAAGRAGGTPAAIIERAATPRQRTVATTLQKLPDEAQKTGVKPPAIIIIGEVVAMHELLGWFRRLPLSGQTILVTRPRRVASELSARLSELGAEVIASPTIAIKPPGSFADVDAALHRLSQFDWVVFTSPNGVEFFSQRLEAIGLDARALGGVHVAVVGPATAAALRERFITPDLVPETFTTEALGEAMRSAGGLDDSKRILLARSDIASAALPELLRRAGAAVEAVAFYRTIRPAGLPEEAQAALAGGEVDWITFSSSSTVENFLILAAGLDIDLSKPKLAAIGPVTAEALKSHGLEPAVVARPHTIDALAEAIVRSG